MRYLPGRYALKHTVFELGSAGEWMDGWMDGWMGGVGVGGEEGSFLGPGENAAQNLKLFDAV